MIKEYITVNIKSLKPYKNNPRKNDEAVPAVQESIKQCGYITPIVVDENLEIMAGNTRYKALLGNADEIQVLQVSGLTDEQKRKYRLLDNKVGEVATWDFDKLELELEGLDFDDYDFGFELNLDDNEPQEIEEDEVPEEVETRCKLGDIWQLGQHRLICGDSTDPAVIDRLMDGVKADMVFTDPPYGTGTSGKYGRGQLGVRTIVGDEDLSVFNDFISIMNTDKIVYFLQWRTLVESLETIRNKGLKVNTVGVWDKKNAGLNGAGGISEQWEAVIFAGNIK
ncbi:MAG: ParB N-terminal domain-containing protein, partial [Clostridia bacterium]|nr:ParB N-terminal domain-containing protein [Clostridia bacterium]